MTAIDRGSTASLRRYTVIGRSPTASAIIYPDRELIVTYRGPAARAVELRFTTRYQGGKFEAPAPLHLWIEANASAESLDEAVKTSMSAASELTAVIALSTNAWMGRVAIDLAYDATPGTTQREYLQSYVEDSMSLNVPGRSIPVPEVTALITRSGCTSRQGSAHAGHRSVHPGVTVLVADY